MRDQRVGGVEGKLAWANIVQPTYSSTSLCKTKYFYMRSHAKNWSNMVVIADCDVTGMYVLVQGKNITYRVKIATINCKCMVNVCGVGQC